jgi:hypothetical protein
MEAAIARSVWRRGTDSTEKGHEILFFSTASKLVLETIESLIQLVPWAVFPGVKRPERECGQLSISCAWVKNGGAVPQLSCTSSCCGAELIKHKDSFAFI